MLNSAKMGTVSKLQKLSNSAQLITASKMSTKQKKNFSHCRAGKDCKIKLAFANTEVCFFDSFSLVIPMCFTAASASQPPSTRSRMVERSSEPRHSDAAFQRPTSRFFFREAAAATEATSPPCSSLGIEDETPPKNMR